MINKNSELLAIEDNEFASSFHQNIFMQFISKQNMNKKKTLKINGCT